MINEWLIIIILIRYRGDLMIIDTYFNKDYNLIKKYVRFVISLSLSRNGFIKKSYD
jgi:hypothetical protein